MTAIKDKRDIIKSRLEKAKLNNLLGPFAVSFTVTNKCNYRCRHCYNNSGEDFYQELTDQELLDVANQICEVHPTSVCLCGGEPLIRGNVIYDIIRKLVQNCGVVNLVSNGFLLTDETLDRLKEAGVCTVQVSLDGNTPFLHENMRMIPNAFEIAISAIRRASQKDFEVAVSFCPNKLNKDAMTDTCLLVKQAGAKEFRIMPLILTGRGINMEALELSADEYLELQQKVFVMNDKYKDGTFSVSWGDPFDHVYRMPENSRNKMNTYSAEIRSDGKLLLCNYLPVVVGDLRKHTIKEYWDAGYKDIWGNKKYQKYIDNLYSLKQLKNYEPKPYVGKDIVDELI